MTSNADFSESFDSDLGNYNDDTGAWNGSEGNDAVGCAELTWASNSIAAQPATGMVITFTPSNQFRFWYRVIDGDVIEDYADILQVWFGVTDDDDQIFFVVSEAITVSDTGWVEYVIDDLDSYFPDEVTLDFIKIYMSTEVTAIYIDDIELLPLPASGLTHIAKFVPSTAELSTIVNDWGADVCTALSVEKNGTDRIFYATRETI